MTTNRSKSVDWTLLFGIGASVVLALIAIFGSGIYKTVYGIRLSSQTVWRPAAVAVVLSALWLRRSESRQRHVSNAWSQALQHSTGVAILLMAVTVAIAFRLSAFEVYASDPYGYVSEAQLWASGNLIQTQPLSMDAPWPEAEWTFSPLGYRPGVQRGTIVPTYPPGLPLVMAGLLKLFGEEGPFFAVPLLGGVAVFATFLLGRRVAGPACGLLSAALLLTSPIFLYQLKEPMSDVPVTAWWLVAILLVSVITPTSCFAGGLAASVAILTRPNLVPLAAVLGMVVLFCSARRRLLNAAAFTAGVIPGCVGVAIVNQKLYGSPLSSGYGGLSGLFNVDYFWANLSRYSAWLLHSETPFILLAVAGFALLIQRERLAHSPSSLRSSVRWSVLFLAFLPALYACYSLYLPFDNWNFLRFLLPAIPLLLVLCSITVLYLSDTLRSFLPRFVLATCFVAFLAYRWDVTGLKPIHPQNRRFAVLGGYVKDHLPSNAIVFSMIHSGSIRYYSGRLTFRWDSLAPDQFDKSIDFFKAHGYSPFLLIEEWERPQFIERYSGTSPVGPLKLTPVATYHGDTRVDVYDLGNTTPVSKPETITLRTQ